MGSATRLRELREKRFLTQQELAGRARVAKVTIARIESGATVPTFSTIKRLAEALGVDPSELVPDVSSLRQARNKNDRGSGSGLT